MFSALLTLLFVSAPHAQEQDPSFDPEIYRPYPDMYGYWATQSAATLGHLQLGTSIWMNYENDPVVLVHEGERIPPMAGGNGDEGDGVLDDRLTLDLTLGMGFTRFFSLTFDLPTIMSQDGVEVGALDNPTLTPETLATSGLGDFRIQPKIVALDGERLPLGLSVSLPLSLPTGTSGSMMSEEGFAFSPLLAVEYSDASLHLREHRIRMAANLGFITRREARLRDVGIHNAFQYGMGVGFRPANPIELVLDFHGQVFGATAAHMPAELLGGSKFLIGRYVAINLAGGAGLINGVGAPDYRFLGGLTVAPSFDPASRDSDRDGIVDGEDRCSKDAEDLDSFQDTDGCPEEDNDADGVPDNADRCPNDPEDDDNYLDNDGCLDEDNDKDRVPDVSDRCPDAAETVNEYQDEDGCPDEKPIEDTDGDGYKDDVDRCPYDAEDFDGMEDEDGCPDRRVVVTEQAIEISESIYFDFGKATIQERSFSLLDEIAGVIKAHPELKKIRVEGHTDNVGDDIFNLKLSQARADSVKQALIERGVESTRLEARGFGEMNPIDTNDTEEGRARNRRVEFIIVSRELQRVIEQ